MSNPMLRPAKTISDAVVIMTRAELAEREAEAFRRGVVRGKLEARMEQSNSAAPGKEGQSIATKSELGSAAGPPNSH